MGTQVITYIDPRKLRGHQQWGLLEETVHICATSSLRAGMVRYYQGDRSPTIQAPILTFNNLIEGINEKWFNPRHQLVQYAHLSQALRDHQKQTQDEQQRPDERVRAFRRNQREVLRSMRTLTEAGLTPSDLLKVPDQSPEEVIFVDLWQRMERADQEFQTFRRLMDNYSQNSKGFQKLLRSAIERCLKDKKNNGRKVVTHKYDVKRLVLHGFYFITPLQHRFLKICEASGVELVFLNCYDERFPSTFQSWDVFFNAQNGWVDKSEWQFDNQRPSRNVTWGKHFADVYEQRTVDAVSSSNSLKIIPFRDFGSFLEYFESNRHSDRYFTSDDSVLNEYLREYFPKEFERPHFLAYPVGKMLLELHQMWDEQSDELVLTGEGLLECFSSGWLQVDGENAKHYVLSLQRLLPFFSDCSRLDEWEERIDWICEIKEDISAHDTDIEGPTKRFHQMMSNLYERIAAFKVSIEDLYMIRAYMMRLFEIANVLFKDHNEERVTIGEHFERIERELFNGVDKESLIDDEKKLVDELWARLQGPSGEAGDDAFLVQDLLEPIKLFLGGDFLSPTETDRNKLIGSLDYLDGVPLLSRKKNIHLCSLHEKTLPRFHTVLPWPLTSTTLDHLAKESLAVKMILLRDQETASSYRYLFYLALAFCDSVHLSWIKEWQQETLEASAYLLLLSTLNSNIKEQERMSNWRSNDVRVREPLREEDEKVLIKKMKKYPQDAFGEYMYCPRRFYLSFLTQDFASFESDFHHQFVYRGLLNNVPEDERDGLPDLFLHWTDVKKKDLEERAFDEWNWTKEYEEIKYLDGRKRVQFLVLGTKGNRSEQLERLDEAIRKRGKRDLAEEVIRDQFESLQMEAIPSYSCRFCPHIEYCSEALYPIDEKQGLVVASGSDDE